MENLSTVTITSDEIEFNKIPLNALRQKIRLILSKLLNPTKLISSDNGLPRDWRGIAYLAGLQNLYGPAITMQSDPMTKVLQLWNDVAVENQTGSFGNLYKFLIVIDRWDVADDIRESLVEDAKFYLTLKSEHEKCLQINATKESIAENQSDLHILTQDDVLRSQQGLSPQQYDGFVIFADEDIDFATELIERMENFGFKLCIKDRDLVGGTSFEHEAIMRLISERCNRLIVIVSPAFLQSSANKFFVNFAQALGIEQDRRKIIPCLYQYCVLPPTLSFYSLLNYQRSGRLWNFWDRLRDSIQKTPYEISSSTPNRAITAPSSIPATITEITNQNSTNLTNECDQNKQLSITLPIKIPRRKHENNGAKSLLSTSTTLDNCNKNYLSVSSDLENTNQALISMNGSISLQNNSVSDMTNSSVKINSEPQKVAKKKWYKKKWFKRKLIST